MNKVVVTINDKAFPCRLTMGAMLRFKRETGRDVVDITNWTFSDLCTLLWCCVASASKHDGLDFKMSLMDFADSITPDELNAWAEAVKDAKASEQADDVEAEEKKAGINDLLGFALGCIRLSYDDFCRCTVEEFESICKAYNSQREAEYKDGWERTRSIAVASLRPYLKGSPSAYKIFPLPWDKQRQQNKVLKPVSAKEDKERFESLVRSIRAGQPSLRP